MRTINRTFSIPEDLDKDLHVLVKKGNMSRFISTAIRNALDQKKRTLREAYRMANEDEGQEDAYDDWKSIMCDGLGECNDW